MNDLAGQIKQSQIPEQISYLAEASDELHKAIEVLENRLSEVLQSSTPITNKNIDDKAPPLVGLAARLHERVASIKVATARIINITSRLEV